GKIRRSLIPVESSSSCLSILSSTKDEGE
ncbi:hypothetical protein CSUI_006154, partial [Cystoisospora suis]